MVFYHEFLNCVCLFFGLVIGYLIGALFTRATAPNKPAIMQLERPSKVLFFPDKKPPCNSFYNSLKSGKKLYCYKLYKENNCIYAHGSPVDEDTRFIEMLRMFNAVRHKLDICMYLISHEQLASFLVHLSTVRKIKIRVISDGKCAEHNEMRVKDQAEYLSKNGIEVRSNVAGNNSLMHNKFVIIDDDQLLVGSFNWTSNAVRRNFESVVILYTPEVVKTFKRKFEEMWRALNATNFSEGIKVNLI